MNFLRNSICAISEKIYHRKQIIRMEETFGFNFMVEKIPHQGEDAEPINIIQNNTFAVAVFDGMGGAGAAKCKSDYGENCTKAYVASRTVKECVKNLVLSENVDELILEDKIKERLKQETERYPSTKSMLRSSLVRDYPTTMAMLIANSENNTTWIDSYWAGDSRNYLWTKEGFYQLSIDDIQSGGDAMENLHNDSRMSNCICADQPFKINHMRIQINEPCILLSATDGCFGYYPSPMHFEAALKDTLKQADNYDQWKEQIQQCIAEVTGDDFSLSLLTVPQLSFKNIKKNMLREMKRFQKIREQEKEIQIAEDILADERSKYQSLLQEIWKESKQQYTKYMNKQQ